MTPHLITFGLTAAQPLPKSLSVAGVAVAVAVALAIVFNQSLGYRQNVVGVVFFLLAQSHSVRSKSGSC